VSGAFCVRRINATAKETPRTRKGDEVKGPKRSDDEPVAAERNTKGTQENCGHGRSQKKRRRKEEKKLENEPCKEAESVQSVDDNVCHVCKDTYSSIRDLRIVFLRSNRMSGKHCDDDWLIAAVIGFTRLVLRNVKWSIRQIVCGNCF